jgi:hypothetical protein
MLDVIAGDDRSIWQRHCTVTDYTVAEGGVAIGEIERGGWN